jgi:uncharacterized membrane protein YhaH (DUF805 family)
MVAGVVFYLVLAVPDRGGSYTGINTLFDLMSLVISIWTRVELGFLRGTAGSNRYGPDPLAAQP